jgi:non-ribosomal peptide synthase protein (TIGR01720 family)
LAGTVRPQVGFNYLGRLPGTGTGTGTEPDVGAVRPWREVGSGPAGGAGEPVRHALEIKGVVHVLPDGPRLLLTLAWPEAVLPEAAARALLDGWAAMLTGLAGHAAQPGTGGHTPSDFALLDLDQTQIDELETALSDEWSAR